MEETKIYKFSELCSKIGSGATPKGGKESYLGGNIALIRSQNVLDFNFSVDGLAYINNEQAQKLNNVSIEENDVLLNITGDSVARACMAPSWILPARVNQHVAIIRGNADLVLNDYLLYFLQYKKSYLLSISQGGATRNALTKRMIEDIELLLPNLSHQRKVVSILRSLDSKIELNRRINDNLEQQAQALFKSWFVDFEPFRSGKFVESELGMIPEGWHIGVPNDIIISTLSGDWGKEKQQGNYTKKVSCIRGADIPYIKMGEKGNMPTRFILEKNYQSKVLTPDDLVIEISGGSPTQSTGRICRISQALLERYNNSIICTNFCKAIKPTLEYSSYLYHLWKMLYKLGIMFSYENGTTGIKNFDINGFAQKEQIIIPPKEIVYAFKQIIETFYVKIQTNGIESEQLTKTRDTLLPRLMSGELNTNDLNS
ncbi:restriction endonuclease subunit S [Bacteroides acidifaciens]|uniref:restriction endonuclease subunit S n=2 Tax=Bacteroides TaxID=816 RepID=UPI0026E9EB54|nr:restriction endonuclease subunit S [Bacteroides acidifaciens]